MSIILDSNDRPSSPHPEPFSGTAVSQEALEELDRLLSQEFDSEE